MSTLDFITGRSERLWVYQRDLHSRETTNHSGGGKEVRAELSKLKVNRAYKSSISERTEGEWKKRLVRADNCVT